MSSIARTGYIETQDGPLCPYNGAPAINDAHRLRNQILDTAYDAAEKSEDSEFVDPSVDKVYNAMAYGSRAGDRMNLYRVSALAPNGGRAVAVEALWFQCPVCGFVLPAQQVTDR